MENVQYISCIRFSLQLLIAESVFLLGYSKRKNFLLRLLVSLTGYFFASTFIYEILTRIPGEIPLIYALYYTSLFGVTLCAMGVSFQMKLKEILFAGVCGYATQHIAFAVSTIARELTRLELGTFWDFIIFRLLPYILISAIIYFVVIQKNKGNWELKDKDFRMIVIAFVILFAAVFLSILVDNSSIRYNTDYLRNVICKIYAILCCVLSVLAAFYLTRQNRLLHEKGVMEEMIHRAREQQKLSKENIAIINIKCHDLKHQISKIATIESKDSQKEYIENVKNAITIYDNIYQTGNEALDLVLTEKSLLCNERFIKLSCMVDGQLLEFMHTTDVYALFGNLLDNAIESVLKEGEEKRIISMLVTKRMQGIHIHIDNYCDELLSFEDGLPVTTKKDRAYHGFGVKSIQYIVEKYKGDLLMQVLEHRFQVDIIFYAGV